MDAPGFEDIELTIFGVGRGEAIRHKVTKAITTIGASKDSDVVVPGAPSEWLVIRQDPNGISVNELASGMRQEVAIGASITLSDGSTLSLAPVTNSKAIAAAVAELGNALAACESAGGAVDAIVRGAIAMSGARIGAVILSEHGSYQVGAAFDAQGRTIAEARQLLSDTLVSEVLSGGRAINIAEASRHERFAHVRSIAQLRLGSVLCLPLQLSGATFGALYLGKHAGDPRFADEVTTMLHMLAALAVPFVSQLRSKPQEAAPPLGLIGESVAMQDVHRMIDKVARTDLSVLVVGQTGTGKEVVARRIHDSSGRSGTMVALNCAAVPESLLDAELFGYCKGAFTGAHSDRKGVIEAAQGTTLFLDEVGDMPLAMQGALLRVLEEKQVRRVGENTPRPVEFRLIAATNKDLRSEVEKGSFRQDLLFRINEVCIELPSLSIRGPDILLLATSFLRTTETQLGLQPLAFSAEAKQALLGHAWPGNVRELRAAVRRAAVLCDGAEIAAADLQLDSSTAEQAGTLGDVTRPLAQAKEAFVDRYVRAVVERHGGNREDAAKALEIGVRTLYRYLA